MKFKVLSSKKNLLKPLSLNPLLLISLLFLTQAAFRRTYIRILKCKWTKSKRTVASQRYQEENRRHHESKNAKYRHWMT